MTTQGLKLMDMKGLLQLPIKYTKQVRTATTLLILLVLPRASSCMSFTSSHECPSLAVRSTLALEKE